MRAREAYIKSNIKWVENFMIKIGVSYKFDYELYREVFEKYISKKVRWVDLGCGENIWVNEYKNVKFKLGIDVRLPKDPIHWKNFCVGDVYKLPLKGDIFDIVTLKFVTEHLQNPTRIFAEIYRILKKEGILIIHTTNRCSPTIIIKNILPQRVRIYLLHRLAGIEEDEIFTTFYKFNTPSLFEKGIRGFNKIKVFYTHNVFILLKPLLYLSCIFYLLTKGTKYCRFYALITAIYKKIKKT